jgi:hypothetical protein
MDEKALRDSLLTDDRMQENILMLDLYKRLHQMKIERKKAEQNTAVLNNRVNLLKNEEFKVFINPYISIRLTRECIKLEGKPKLPFI